MDQYNSQHKNNYNSNNKDQGIYFHSNQQSQREQNLQQISNQMDFNQNPNTNNNQYTNFNTFHQNQSIQKDNDINYGPHSNNIVSPQNQQQQGEIYNSQYVQQQDQQDQQQVVGFNNNDQFYDDGFNQNMKEFNGEGVHERVIYLRKVYLAGFLSYAVILAAIYYIYYYQHQQVFDFFKENTVYFYYSIIALTALQILGQLGRSLISNPIVGFIFWLLFTGVFGVFWLYIISIYDYNLSQFIYISLSSVFLNQFVYLSFVRIIVTYQGASLFIFGSQLIVFQIFSMFTDISLLSMIMVLCGSFIFSFYMAYITQKKAQIESSTYFQEQSTWLIPCLVYSDIVGLVFEKF